MLFFCRVCLFVQQETKARKPQHSTPRGCSVHTARPNIDNVDNMDTDGRRVEAIPHEQEKQTAPNMDNVDNRTQTRPPCGEEEAAPALFFCRVCSVCPFV